jgi:hypothetical protein
VFSESYMMKSPAKALPKPLLHIVVASGRFDNITELERHVQGLMKKYPDDEPHVFLYPETPFDRLFQLRKDVKASVKKISASLAKDHQNSAVAFSVGEIMRSGPSNTGYLVLPHGYKTYPKLVLTSPDTLNISVLEQDMKKHGEEFWDSAKWWRKRAGRWGMKPKTVKAPVFPTYTFPATGHKVQFRVCADLATNPRAKRGEIVLVSARGISQVKLDSGKKEQPLRNLTVINDSWPGQDYGPRVVTPTGNGIKLESNDEQHPPLLLPRLRLQIHYPKPAPVDRWRNLLYPRRGKP